MGNSTLFTSLAGAWGPNSAGRQEVSRDGLRSEATSESCNVREQPQLKATKTVLLSPQPAKSAGQRQASHVTSMHASKRTQSIVLMCVIRRGSVFIPQTLPAVKTGQGEVSTGRCRTAQHEFALLICQRTLAKWMIPLDICAPTAQLVLQLTEVSSLGAAFLRV